jgi:cysteine synthase
MDMLTAKRIRTPTETWLQRAHTESPLQRLDIHRGSQSRSAWLKLEMFNPTGSVKYRTALSLLQALDRECRLVPGTTIVESTSGNLGLALAQLSAEIGCRYVAVVDPRLTSATREAMAAVGANIIMVKDRDRHGGYLLSRLRVVRELCAASAPTRWANQYEGMANPAVHRDVTAPELVHQTHGRIDMVVVAVSTGGTLAGLSEYLRRATHSVHILAVDVAGSLAISGSSRSHLLTGIGATRRSSFLRPHHYDHVAHVRDIDAFAACRLLEQDTGLALGGSSGAVLAAFLTDPPHHSTPPRFPVLFCPDGGFTYRDTIYNDSWLSSHGALDTVNTAITEARRNGLQFDLGEITSHVPI